MKTALLVLLSASAAFGLGCESLKELKLAHTTITAAETVAAGFCRVAATLAPSADSVIQIEVWMPAAKNWNNDLQSIGNGAWAGTINNRAMMTALAEGYATASTDTGHTGNNANFITGHPEKMVDFAYRAVHEMTVAAKAIVQANYGRAAAKSYFNGCSTGGRQALAESQRYPGDYDGIIAGAAANYTTRLQGAQVWTTLQVTKTPEAMIPAAKYPALHAAALEACDALDGVKDGVIENPMRCKFDPKTIVCKDVDAATCLTAPQAEAARMTYQGPQDSKGNSLFPGMEPGSETGWNTLSAAKPMAYADEIYKYLVFKDDKWDYQTFNPERDMAQASRESGALMDSIDPDLRPFFNRGGKLLMYHGWADPGIAPRNSVNYYESVVKKVGEKTASSDIRLFMVPGMGHCGGGDGTSTFNAMAALRDWVEQSKTPETIAASRVRNGQTDRTRPLCAYPQVAKYKGTGNTDDASNFSCALP